MATEPGRDPSARQDILARREGAHAVGGKYHWNAYGVEGILPPAEAGNRIVLIGCGDGGERPFLTARGFQVRGLDINPSRGTDVVADAHDLPFADDSFDVALSMQVLEHLHSPWRAMDEIARVVRPGGYFVGSVAFLKGYHESYFHMSHLGVTQLMRAAGFEVDYLAGAQSITYSIFGALLPLGPRGLRRAVLGTFDRLLFGARKAVWSLTRRKSPAEPSGRWRTVIPVSFEVFDRMRWAPAVVFRGRRLE